MPDYNFKRQQEYEAAFFRHDLDNEDAKRRESYTAYGYTHGRELGLLTWMFGPLIVAALLLGGMAYIATPERSILQDKLFWGTIVSGLLPMIIAPFVFLKVREVTRRLGIIAVISLSLIAVIGAGHQILTSIYG